MDIPRMRTVKQAVQEIRQTDEQTALTEFALRRMISDGKIPTVSVGNKILVNLDLLLDILSGYRYNKEAVCVSGKEDETWRQ